MPQIPPGSMPTAQQRAAMNLQQRFGPQAAQQVSQLHQQSGPPRPQNFPTAPYPKSEDQKPLLSSLPAYSPTISQNSNPAVKIAQNDGADDAAREWDAMTTEARTFAAQNPGYADRMMRDHLIQVQNQLEGGGLLIPLDEKPASRKALKRKITPTQEKSISDGRAQSEPGLSKNSLVRAQGDAAADEEDAGPDEDAINSDLDDSDDREGEEEDQENTDQMMLCTYDKVQRVKNKWKCTLKDGIVRVGGKE
jgi:transcription initiation factor TFIIA large subunit